jgi:hypothetical protein
VLCIYDVYVRAYAYIQKLKMESPTLITNHLRTVNQQTVNMVFAECFAMNALSHNLLNRESFIQMLQIHRQSISSLPPTAQALRAAIISRANDIRQEVVQKIVSAGWPVTVAVDGWTNVRHEKVTNIVLLACGTAFYWASITNTDSANTADWLYDRIAPHFERMIQSKLRIVGMVADNEAVNSALHRRLKAQFPFLILVPCTAHTIQLAIKYTMELPVFSYLKRKVLRIVQKFDKNKDLRLRLKNLQAGEPHVYPIIKPNDTRWSSMLTCIQRLLKLQKYIQIIFEQPMVFWQRLTHLEQFLLPFKQATNVVQSDDATLVDVYLQLSKLSSHVAALSKDSKSPFRKAAKGAYHVLSHNWRQHIHKEAISAAAVFSLRESEGNQDAMLDFVSKFGAEYIAAYALSKETDKAKLQGIIVYQYMQFVARRTPFEAVDARAAVIKENTPTGKRADFRLLWHLYQSPGSALELSATAIAILSLGATEASVERTFSAQDNVHRKKRNRLDNDVIEAEMCICVNKPALDKRLQMSYENTVELTESVESTDVNDCSDDELIEMLVGSTPGPGDELPIDSLDHTDSEPDPSGESETDPISEPESDSLTDTEMKTVTEPEPGPDRSHGIQQTRTIVEMEEQQKANEFIDWYLSEHPEISRSYRWTSDNFNALLVAQSAFKYAIKARTNELV